MLGKLPDRNQREIFHIRLEDLINPQHELALLADKIDWAYFEKEFNRSIFRKYLRRTYHRPIA